MLWLIDEDVCVFVDASCFLVNFFYPKNLKLMLYSLCSFT